MGLYRPLSGEGEAEMNGEYISLTDKIPVKSPQTASRLIDNEAVIVVPQESEVKVLNESGSRIWELIDGKRDIRQIAEQISGEFEVPPEQALKDITGFVRELLKKQLVILNSREEAE